MWFNTITEIKKPGSKGWAKEYPLKRRGISAAGADPG
jgi:hypothetical protein